MARAIPSLPHPTSALVDTGARIDRVWYQRFDDIAKTLRDMLVAWTAYTPTVAAGSGSFTSASATGAYMALGKTVLCRGVITITTCGTAFNEIVVSLPSTTAATAVGSAFESQATDLGLVMRAASGATTASILKTDGTTIIADGRTVEFSMNYEQT